LVQTSVSTIIENAAEIWGYKDNAKCEKVHERAAQYYLGVHSKAPLLALTGDIGWMTAKLHRHIKMAKYWNRLINMENHRLTKTIFLYDKTVCKINWSSEVKLLFENVDMSINFDNMTEIDVDVFVNKSMSEHNDQWKSNISVKPKLRSYVKFKDSFIAENYVKHCQSRRKHSLLAQFRLGILPIAIETGRFKGIAVNERLCKLCSSDAVQDEKHLLCECCLYNDLCHNLYNYVSQSCMEFINMNNEDKFCYMLKNNWQQVGNFLNNAWHLRTQILYLYV
jgi:hypothetical protein